MKKHITTSLNDYINEKTNNILIEGWHVGDLNLNYNAGGIWFAETKEGAEKFAKYVRNNNENAKHYLLTIKNPYYYDSFWSGYLRYVEKGFNYNRGKLMEDLIEKGHDGIIINTDTWNDTGDEYSVTSKQYVVFDENQIQLYK